MEPELAHFLLLLNVSTLPLPSATIINFCPTGMVPTREQSPYVPLSPTEIIEEVHEAFELGITIVHLHARDEEGKPTPRADVYASIFEGVRKHCPGLLICGSTSGRTHPDFEDRSAVIELYPDLCSLTLSSLNFAREASVNTPDTILALAEKMKKYGVHPELECFDLGMIHAGKQMIRKGILTGPFYWNLLFGNAAGWQTSLLEIGLAVNELQGEEHWIALAGIGKDQLTANAIAIAKGWGVRVGLEDNLWWDAAKTKKADNLSLLRRIHSLMTIHDRPLMTAQSLGQSGFYNANYIHTRVQ